MRKSRPPARRVSQKAAHVFESTSKRKTSGEFLFEIGCEEIPAGLIQRASGELKEILQKHFTASGIAPDQLQAFGAPRRLAVFSGTLPLRQKDEEKEILGPPKSVAFDNVGQPTRAAASFSEKTGIPVECLAITNTPRGEYLVARQTIRGRSTREILAEILPRAIRELSFPRSMYWDGKNGPRFIRPIRWLVALLDGEVIPTSFGKVPASDWTRGHRFLGTAKIRVSGIKDYVEKLRRNFVLVDPVERRVKIEHELRAIASQRKWRVHDDAKLLDSVVYLNEYPTVISGDFDPQFLNLPAEILITVMRDHQKYFAVESRHGALEPHFLAVINMKGDRTGQVRAGHERVLRARLADAEFFWAADQKKPLARYVEKLAHITYESRLGSYADKTERVRDLARWLAGQWFDSGIHGADVPAADRAAELCKCDLATEMVREFTELQGIVGGLYARAQNEEEEIASAIYDHYKPVGTENTIPRNLTGRAVSIADKLDSLVACFAVGIIPSGSSDPFALRRAASGIVQILLECDLPLSLSAAVSSAARGLREKKPKVSAPDEVQVKVLEFIADRAKFLFREKFGFAYDEVNAAMAASADDLVDVRRRILALRAIRRSKNFEPLAVAFKRIRKILEKAGITDGQGSQVKNELLREAAERELHESAQAVAQRAASQKRAGKYKEALEAISELRPAVDRFFDDVLVMAEDVEVRRNRLALLAALLREFSTIADFSEIAAQER